MFDDLLRANADYAAHFSLKGIPPIAAKGMAIVICMDSRIEPLTMLGLKPGDAKILRNAGARVTPDTLRSLILATNFLHVREIALIQHTKCALANRHDSDVLADLPAGQAGKAAGIEFLAMPDPDEALRSDVEVLRGCDLFPAGVRVEGWRYDVDTGRILRVVA